MTDRRGPHTLLMQDFVDALRECMGKDPLYHPAKSKRVDAVRFYVPPMAWLERRTGCPHRQS